MLSHPPPPPNTHTHTDTHTLASLVVTGIVVMEMQRFKFVT